VLAHDIPGARWHQQRIPAEEETMKAFLLGLGVGLGLGVLVAPMSGEETRYHLQERALDLADSARETCERGLERIQRTVSSICGEGSRLTGTAAGV
jgi:gas vesicle protein